MASGNSWQVYQELGFHETNATTTLNEDTVRRAKSFSHRDTKPLSERLRHRQSLSFKMARNFGQKWLKKAQLLLDETETNDDLSETSDFTTATDFTENDQSPMFYDAQSEFRSKLGAHAKRGYSIPATFAANPNCPLHGARAARRRAQQRRRTGGFEDFDASSSCASFFLDNSPTFDLMAKLARKQKRAALPPARRERVSNEKAVIIKNLLTISVAFLFLISAFQGLQNLQVTINGRHELGAISLSCVYLGLVVSCLFSPPYLQNRLGCKLTLTVSMSMYSLYMLINFVPKWYSMVPGSLALGFAAAPLWAAKCTYLSETGIRYAELNYESPNTVIVRFFGIFFMIVHLGQIFGNLISSYILQIGLTPAQIESDFVDGVEDSCGHFYVATNNLSAEAMKRLTRPEPRAINSLYGVYFCCTLVAILIVATFLRQLPKDKLLIREKPRFKLEMWHKTLEHMKKPKHLLLIPLTIFNGMEQAFIAGVFTKAYVGCCLGIHNIGSVMTCFGACDAICSLFFGPLIKLFGRMPLFMFGAVVDMLMIFTLLIWPPNPADTGLFYVVAAAWGMADGVWNTQINGLWVVLFAQNLEVAFANYRLWESVGFVIGFTTTSFISTEGKLYFLLGVLIFGMFGYGLIEIWEPLEEYSKRLRQKMQNFTPILKRSRVENVENMTYSMQPILKRQSEYEYTIDSTMTSIHI